MPYTDTVINGELPIVAAAIHDGHALRPQAAEIMALSAAERLREEDPFTAAWTTIVDDRLIGTQSRFEVDLNRPREKAVYIQPEDCWGLHVWKETPSSQLITGSLAVYDAFYQHTQRLFSAMAERFKHFVVFDLHTYNHRREGPEGPAADAAGNPEVNLGTGTMNRAKWAPIIDRFQADLSTFDFLGRGLDVRENIKFRGGQLGRWTHENFPDSACVISIEYKKFFMDEWSGTADAVQLAAIRQSLQSTIPGVLATLKTM